ncbi:DUF1553 domain-containing protein [Thalassoglobus sp. JC818]|uniref:DUF1553 domain-containing protein n=1 Tax=Thalassoglobus sp. JC818 TaxID=3232136 RepID=UPI00345A73FC
MCRFLFWTTLPLLFSLQAVADSAGIEFFEQKIRPVLIKHCYECHSVETKSVKGGLLVDSAAGLLNGGDSGPSLVAGRPDESVLLEALRYESYEMPPSGKLPEEVIQDFEKWVSMGAPDSRTDPVKGGSESKEIDFEAARQFWAFQPPESHVVPTVQDVEWPRSWIDSFVLSELEAHDLQPMPDVERSSLIRRIAYDLTGLPPSLDDLKALDEDASPKAIEAFIDRLLASQRFAEHWARHWLDVARYADSNGADFNATFHNAWRYRNYVIDTFHEDRPFDEFVREQIAGDFLDAESMEETSRNLIATGFLMVGTKMLSERDKEKLRMDVVDEQINSIGKVFLGMTVGCARCHDHKFDPIPTSDYYALAGILRSTQTLDGEIQKYVSNWTRQPLPMTEEHEQSLAEYNARVQKLEKEIKEAQTELTQLEDSSTRSLILEQGILIDDSEAKLIGNWKSSTYSKNFIGKGYIHDDKQDLGQKKVIFEVNVPEDGEYEVRLAFPGSGGRASNVPVVIDHAEGSATISVDQTKRAKLLTMLQPVGRFPIQADKPFVVTISNTDTNGYVIVDALQVVNVNELSEENTEAADENLAKIEAQREHLDQLKARLKEVKDDAPPPAPVALAVREAEDQGDYSICIRGEPRNLGAKVPRGFLTVATYDSAPEIPAGQSGRLSLAEWLADPQNPLTARVYVNRVWQHLIGHGLVRSVDNFGHLGERPSHPQLLDQLAVEFIQHNWSTKWLIREIVLSRTYQQTSEHDESRWKIDPENRLLWRMNRKPLSAEQIRDTMLQATGSLDDSQTESPVAALGTLVSQNNPNDAKVQLASTNTRTIYQPVIRNELSSLMRVFDFADPDFVTGRRAETTVPTQSLWMLNSPMISERSQIIGKQITELAELTSEEKVQALYRRILGRTATSQEAEVAIQFVSPFEQSPAVGTNSESDSKTPEIEPNAEDWADLAHAIIASSTFRMLD